jgi:hypothetical protein
MRHPLPFILAALLWLAIIAAGAILNHLWS